MFSIGLAIHHESSIQINTAQWIWLNVFPHSTFRFSWARFDYSLINIDSLERTSYKNTLNPSKASPFDLSHATVYQYIYCCFNWIVVIWIRWKHRFSWWSKNFKFQRSELLLNRKKTDFFQFNLYKLTFKSEIHSHGRNIFRGIGENVGRKTES